MENESNAEQIELLKALQRDLATALADLKMIKNHFGISAVPPPPPGPSPLPPPGPSPGEPIM
ncbi:hypothetical protein [Fibrisoma montanum]|uniref:hypothetical protein n=1 Tax=Fibrisoma montanum TaxID=2305895 RepID=UPI0013144590|nr:hypothetical protein [Fibrisoma montanum]